MIKKNKRFNYISRYNTDSVSYFTKKSQKYKSNFFLFIILIILFLLVYLIINYQV